MKKRIFSLLVTLVVAVSVILGVSLFANAAETDGLKGSAISLAENGTLKMEVAIAEPTDGAYAKITLPGGKVKSGCAYSYSSSLSSRSPQLIPP